MDLNKIPLMGLLAKRMQFLGARQKVIAENVANADTPGFRPLDIKNDQFARQVAKVTGDTQMSGHLVGPQAPTVTVSETNAHHMLGTLPVTRAGQDAKKVDDYEVTPSGNAVVLEEEMARMAGVQADHEMASSVYRKQVAFIKLVLGRSGS